MAQLLVTDSSLEPEKPVAESDVDSTKVMTPVGGAVIFEEVKIPHTAAILPEREKIWRRPSPILSFSSSGPSSNDVRIRLHRGQLHRKPMPPFRMAHTQHHLLSEAQDLQATQHHLGDKQSKSFWYILSLRNVIVVAAVASIVFLVAAFVFVAYIAPPLFELTTLGKQTSSHRVAIHEAVARGTHSLWKPLGRPASQFTSASEAALACLVNTASALVEFTHDMACVLLFGRLKYQLREYD
ncbi:uncharacterized protein FPRO_11567 [Fusarium proliferatum ET1]|uniref:Uncharacterized protein n=1 Tax=Fusarium proliferatum (strain ET1) TaxID=1227346 RepID=A0A1L7W0E7_FUSPR|nr:uncharacterized protein FPRO_11567 [Fusarium proliferatum ET1]CZR46120.1 uncharacterized protein FPRO_11567 [Fusarium proliferatum ET1]